MKRERNMIKLLNGVVTRSALLSLLVALSAIPAEARPFAYVANRDTGNVSVIDTATNPPTVVATIPLGINLLNMWPSRQTALVPM